MSAPARPGHSGRRDERLHAMRGGAGTIGKRCDAVGVCCVCGSSFLLIVLSSTVDDISLTCCAESLFPSAGSSFPETGPRRAARPGARSQEHLPGQGGQPGRCAGHEAPTSPAGPGSGADGQVLSSVGPAGHAAAGRPPRYCSPACRKARHRQRTREAKRAARPAAATGALTQLPRPSLTQPATPAAARKSAGAAARVRQRPPGLAAPLPPDPDAGSG